jgi:hypothetical protein
MATQKSTYFPAYGGAASEQGLAQDLVDEHIKIHGSTVFYLPRTLNNIDNLFHETTTASFTSAVEIEMYMKSYDKFDGLQDDTITQFGLRNNDALTFVVSKRRWQEEFDGNFAGQLADDRPAEGDLIYFPLSKGLFEIKYVEHQTDMYQLGNFYSYELRCELFEYADEEIETGVTEIDEIELEQSAAIKLFMDPGGTGDFTVGEEVVGDEFLAFATANLSGDIVSSITITDGGAHYKTATPPSVTITAPPASGGLSLFNTSTSTGSYANTTGTGYTTGTYTTTNLTGGGSGAIASVYSVVSDGALSVSGGALTFTLNNRGTGYSQGDVLRIDGGDDNAYVRIVSILVTRPATATATVSASGIVSGITITDAGAGYTTTPTVTIDYSPKDNRAEVKSWNSSTRELQVINRTGVFTTAETVTGLTSGAKWSPESYDQTLALNNTNSVYDQSLTIETESDNIIDFTEVNPFGEF